MTDSRDGLQVIDAEVTDSVLGGAVASSPAASMAEEGQKKKTIQHPTKQCVDCKLWLPNGGTSKPKMTTFYFKNQQEMLWRVR